MTTQNIEQLVERQFRFQELARRQSIAEVSTQPANSVHPYVAISREVAAGGSEVARQLAGRLGWAVFDRDLIDFMANSDAQKRRLYAEVDERNLTWIEHHLRWALRGEVLRDNYFDRLIETTLLLAKRGPSVFVGRGTDMILPRECGICVRLVAPLAIRVKALAHARGIDENEAERVLAELDSERRQFIRRHFHCDASDPARGDMILNLGRWTQDQAVDLIVYALRQRKLLPE